jgi:nucleotidyltransferase-like protein
LHHGAFDAHLIAVRPDYRIEVRRDVLEESDGPMLIHGLQGFHDQPIRLPAREAQRPSQSLLEARYALFRPHLAIDSEAISAFCRRHHTQRFALFGSVLSDDFRPDSDIDVLVEFESGHVPGFRLTQSFLPDTSPLTNRSSRSAAVRRLICSLWAEMSRATMPELFGRATDME